ncbi:MAG: hypothetical protein A4E72_00677 [Syntrophus sp. PtaU1.Bin208]|nr:MAG: hypothetical protein A4E72_00677 [Syntrophus sp. PtaU1.Bin208]
MIAAGNQLGDKILPRNLAARCNNLQIGVEKASRNDLLHEGFQRGDDDGRFVRKQTGQDLHADQFDVALQGEHFRTLNIPGGIEEDLVPAEKEGKIRKNCPRLFLRRAQNDHGPAELFRQSREQKGIGRAVQPVDG